jgi:hypothetical protein
LNPLPEPQIPVIFFLSPPPYRKGEDNGELHVPVVTGSIQWVKMNMECVCKVYEKLVGPFRALDGRNARRRHGRAAAMGVPQWGAQLRSIFVEEKWIDGFLAPW